MEATRSQKLICYTIGGIAMYTHLGKQVLSLTESKLSEWHGQKVKCDALDLVAQLYEADIEDETFGYGRNTAFTWLSIYMQDLSMAEAFDEIKHIYENVNPFADPERFQVLVFVTMARELVRASKTYLTLLEVGVPVIFTDELIDKICKEWREALEI